MEQFGDCSTFYVGDAFMTLFSSCHLVLRASRAFGWEYWAFKINSNHLKAM